MLNVFFTIDVEVWCDGWQDIDRKFARSFQRYIHGPDGRHGLPDQLRMLADHGHQAICFVEPLFAGRFGLDPLAEIVGLIEGSGHEAELHLHTEWVDEALEPMLPGARNTQKRQHLRHFDREEQTRLIEQGSRWLQAAGAPKPTAFRAGNFGFNIDTLSALAANGIAIDSSYNASLLGPSSGLSPDELLLGTPRRFGDVLELPMTVYEDGRGLRHAQLTACSWGEMEGLLWQAAERELGSFVILSHGSELLTPGLEGPDPVVISRLRKLSAFLDRHRDSFVVRGSRGALPAAGRPMQGRPLQSPLWRTGLRIAEQAWRRRYA